MKQTSGRLGEVAGRITAPFGSRSLTAAQIAAQADASRPADGVVAEKWRVLHDLTTARVRYGLSSATLVVLEALLTCLPERMLAPTDDAPDLVVFPSNRSLAARARGLSEAALRRHLSALVEAGLVIRRDSPNGKRYVRRGEGGQITHAYGFDLTPLAVRASEIAALADTVRAEALAQSLARETVSLLRRDCAKLLDALDVADGTGDPGEPTPAELRERYCALVASYPRRPEPAEVAALGEALEALALAVSRALIFRQESKKVSGSAAHFERHIQNSTTERPDCEKASRDKEKVVGIPGSRRDPAATAHTAVRSTYPLHSVLDACPQVQDFARSGIRSWDDLMETADRIRPMLGISAAAWSDAQDAMGPEAAAITLAAMLERSESIKSHGGYLRALTERKRDGKYSLGPVLQALRRSRINFERVTG
ncbi:plasmid replication protein RepC [Methylobacterium indicum]|uniref:Replication initiation protein n=1 Tax=Methylobacterium indicum TaxID=1775910 RepID=A0A8H9CAC9_9HYPH|nr:plasmid replication protein RepC [Methylobacterium indicum]BCM88026.1 replication initiation protein [Methylobacterium indicum]